MSRKGKKQRRLRMISNEYGALRRKHSFRGRWALGALIAILLLATWLS